MLQLVTGEELEGILTSNAESTVLVVFTSAYLGNCRILIDIIEELIEEFGSNMNFYNVDADEEEGYVAEKGIYQVPTTMMYSNSELVFYGEGLMSKSNLRKKLKAYLN